MSSKDGALRVGVVGCGAFGRNHARVYRDLHKDTSQNVEFVGVADCDSAQARTIATEFGTQAFRTPDELIAAGVQAVSVAVPTVSHLEVASKLLENGVDVLIEKPLATSVAEADELIALARKHRRVAQAGHLERFNPAVRATVPLLKQPMFFEVHRLSVFTPRSLDVDVILDLMIHDLDVVLSFVKSPVKEIRAVGLPILSKKVDIANVRMEFDSGCVANFTASRVSTERVRKLRFFQPHQYISIDYARQDLLVIDVDPRAAPTSAETGLPPGLAVRKPTVHSGEPLLLEIESFLDCVRSRATPRVSGQDGLAALALALDINAAIAAHAQRAGLDRF
jgi:predicted dehydrogenase